MNALATGDWLTRDRLNRVGWICVAISALIVAGVLATSHGTLMANGRPLGTDFSNVWTAGRMALEGRAVDTWTWKEHFAVQQAVHGRGVDLYAWIYPPPFLLVAAALASLPYVAALILWQVVTLAPFAWLLHRMVPRRETLLLTLGAPVTLICLLHGHNGFLTALLLGGGLVLLERRPLAAGLLFGCLLYKPQFALILPPLLLVGGRWRTILGACLSAGLLIGVTLLLWGWPVWAAFLAGLPQAQQVVVEQGTTGFYKMTTAFAAVRIWGGSVATAYGVQSLFTALTVAGAMWVGRRQVDGELRAAFICAAVLLSSPYAFDYDFAVLLPAIAFLWRHAQREGWRPYEKSLLAMVWLSPLIGRQVAEHLLIPIDWISTLAAAGIALRRTFVRAPQASLAAA